MTDPNQPNQPVQPDQPVQPGQPSQPWPPPYQLPPNYQPPPPQPAPRSGMPAWAIALIAGCALLLVLCVIGAIVSIGVLTLLGSKVSQVFSQIESGLEEGTPTPINRQSALPIGSAAELPDLRITVTSAHPLAGGAGAPPPASGKQYWAVEVTFENTSSDPATLSVFSSSVRDAAGASYPYSIVAQRASPDPGFRVVESLRPGATASGTLFYELPQDASALFWSYEDVNGGEQVAFKIK